MEINQYFSKKNEEPTFECYLAQTHFNYNKTKLSALKSIFRNYANGLNIHMKECSEDRKAKLRDLKTQYSVTGVGSFIRYGFYQIYSWLNFLGGFSNKEKELQELASENDSGTSNNNSTSIGRDGGTTITTNTNIGTINVGGMALNIGSNQEHTQKRGTDNEIPEPLRKRQRVKIVNPDYTDSGAISDDSEDPNSQQANPSSLYTLQF